MSDYVLTSRHSEPLANGRSVEPEERVTLTEEEAKEPRNKRLIERGLLKLVPEESDADDKPARRVRGSQQSQLQTTTTDPEADDNPEGNGESA